MKTYAGFLIKRISRRKTNIFLIIVSIVILCFIQVMNVTMQHGLRDRFESQIKMNEEVIDEYTAKLSDIAEDSFEFIMFKDTIELNESSLKSYNELLMYYDNEDWSSLYKKYKNVLEEEQKILENSTHGINEDESYKPRSDSFNREIKYIEYLDENNLAYEDDGYAIFALSFLTSVSQTILPILVLICCIYIVSQLFTMDYNDIIDISKLLPIGKKKKECTKLLVGIGISISIFLCISLAIYLFSFCTTSNLGFDYPLMVRENHGQTWNAINLMSILKDWIFLGILFYISSCFATYLLSNYFKEEVSLFLITICMILGLAYLPDISGILMPVSQYMPTTYLNFVNILNGSIANRYFNYDITLMNGILILSISILLQFILYSIKNRTE